MITIEYIVRVGGHIHTTSFSRAHAIAIARRLRDVEHRANVKLYSRNVQTDNVPGPPKGYVGTLYVPFNDPLRGSC